MEPFDIEGWLEQAKVGRAELVQSKRELMKRRNEIDEKIAEIDAGIEKIEAVAGPAIGENGKRSSGVQTLVRAVVADLSMPRTDYPERNASRLWDEEEIVTETLRRDPMMKPTSIRSSLRTLVGKDEVERQGKRGSHTYRWKSHVAEQPSVEDRIRNALANAGNEGVSKKDLVWKAGDEGATGTLLDTLVNQGVVERIPVGEGEYRFRIVRAEESEQPPQKTLFTGAEPPHDRNSP